MNKSNNIRINKKLQHLPTDPALTLQLNKSLPALAEFLTNSPTSALHRELLRDTKDHTPSAHPRHNLKVRTHSKAPRKRLALLLDAYSDPNNKKYNCTLDNLEGSSRETSAKSPQSSMEGYRRTAQARHSGLGNNFTALDFLKSKEFSKLAVSKAFGKSDIKSVNQGRESAVPPEDQSYWKEGAEMSLPRDTAKKIAKSGSKEEKKDRKSRDDYLRVNIKVRKGNALHNDLSNVERLKLNVSQPQSTKSQRHVSINFPTSPSTCILPRTTTNQDRRRKKDKDMVSQGRSPSELKSHDLSNNSLQLGTYYRPRLEREDREMEKHKKTFSTSNTYHFGSSSLHINTINSIKKDASSQHHRKGVSGVALKLNLESNRDTPQVASTTAETKHGDTGDHSRSKRANIQSIEKTRGLGYEPLMTEPRKRPQRDELIGMDEKRPKSNGKRGPVGHKDEAGMPIDFTSLGRLETAFDAFLEDNKKKIKKTSVVNQNGMTQIVKAWEAFRKTLGVAMKENKTKKEGDTERRRVEKLVKVQDLMARALENDEFERTADSRTRSAKTPSQLNTLLEKKLLDKDGKVNEWRTEGQISSESEFYEQDDLKDVVQKQQGMIDMLKMNELRMMKLIQTLKKQGLDVDEIYQQDDEEKASQETPVHYETIISLDNTNQEQNKIDDSRLDDEEQTIVSLIREDEDESLGNIEPAVYQKMKIAKTFSDARSTTDSTPFPTGTMTSDRVNPLLKNKLRLDLTGLNGKSSKPGSPVANGILGLKLNLNEARTINNEDRPGFHEEFMARVGEFSLSWRQEALNHRNI